MPPFIPSFEEDLGSSPEPADDASEKIHRLFQNMPEIEIAPEDRANTPRQMSCKLMEHQKVALKWLKDQENNLDKKGGLLADTMGLGKTIEALALIIAHRPPDSGPKTTLVVAPLALLKQWNREIADKIKPAHRLTTFIYHGREKKTKKANRLYGYDIVITTYETIASEYKRVERNGTRQSPLFTNTRGFYRIILDEAHKIKNRNAWCSKAVSELRAQFRLCMTGTPFMNNTAEIFSLVRFLQIAPYNDWTHFNHHIEKPLRGWKDDEKDVAMQRLQVLFRSITLRRTKDSVLDGRPILKLPELTITSITVELDEEQRAYYNAIEQNHQKLVNKYLKRSRLSKVITFILVLLTRLRQVCDHPYLIKSQKIPNEAALNAKQMIRLAMQFEDKVVDRIKKIKDFQCPVCEEPVEIPIIIYPCGHDICPDCFSTMMQFGIEAAKNAEQSQAGLMGISGYANDVETKCPHDGCDSDILANKVVCHDFFLDAHSPQGASQVEEEVSSENSEEESDDCCASDDEEADDTEDDDRDLQDFIVPDGDVDSSIDSDESDVDGEEDYEEPSCADHTPLPDACIDDEDDVDVMDETAVKIKTQANSHGLVKTEQYRSFLDRSPIPKPFVKDDALSIQPQAERSSPHGRECSAPVPEDSLPGLGNDMWGRVLTRLRESKQAGPDVDSDSDLDSLNDLVTKSKSTSKQATPAVGTSNHAAGKRKRGLESAKVAPKKRVKLEDEQKRKRNSGKARKKEKRKNKKGKGKTLAQLKKIGSTSKAAKAQYLGRLRRDWESSAKVDVTLNILRKIRDEKPTEKTLVFSLWTSFLDLLEVPLQDEKFRYLRYDGSMTFNERDDNVKTFSEDRNENILLVSLMAGNAGLNLTAASQVIVLEPFWNPFVEDQAIDRAHRIGQSKAVEVHRLLVSDSVEDRILALQEKKRKLVNTALSEEGAQGASRLTIGELRGLFGLR
ncbi:hypothetical protein N0V82_001062 [Gnomoniopsis sp. IMI 355080]|nr:hypothetical protein N0V82_001062 [Gnomoniopsis sp. IMI 355080]